MKYLTEVEDFSRILKFPSFFSRDVLIYGMCATVLVCSVLRVLARSRRGES